MWDSEAPLRELKSMTPLLYPPPVIIITIITVIVVALYVPHRLNPLRPNSYLSQTSHYNAEGLIS